jgi:hypothetical protein
MALQAPNLPCRKRLALIKIPQIINTDVLELTPKLSIEQNVSKMSFNFSEILEFAI